MRKMAASIITLAKLYTYTLNSSSEADTSNKFSSEPELADSLNDHTDGKEGSFLQARRKQIESGNAIFFTCTYYSDRCGHV